MKTKKPIIIISVILVALLVLTITFMLIKPRLIEYKLSSYKSLVHNGNYIAKCVTPAIVVTDDKYKYSTTAMVSYFVNDKALVIGIISDDNNHIIGYDKIVIELFTSIEEYASSHFMGKARVKDQTIVAYEKVKDKFIELVLLNRDFFINFDGYDSGTYEVEHYFIKINAKRFEKVMNKVNKAYLNFKKY